MFLASPEGPAPRATLFTPPWQIISALYYLFRLTRGGGGVTTLPFKNASIFLFSFIKIAITFKVLIFTYFYLLFKFSGPSEVNFPIYSDPAERCLKISQIFLMFTIRVQKYKIMAYFHQKLDRSIKFGETNYIWTNFMKKKFFWKRPFWPPYGTSEIWKIIVKFT